MRIPDLAPWMLSFALFMPLAACDDDDGGDDSAGDSANATDSGDDSGNDSGDDSSNSQTSSSEETCVSSHQCINGACTCQTPGLEDQPCTDDEACEEECEICS